MRSDPRGGPVTVGYVSYDTARYTASALALLTAKWNRGSAPVLKRRLKPLTTSCTLPAGTHDSISTKLKPIHDPECQEKDLLPADQRQVFIQSSLPDCFDAALSHGRLPVSTENGDSPQ